MTVRRRDFDSREDYLDACMERDIECGTDRKKAQFTREMYEANGEEWEDQYGGEYGF